MLLLATLFCVAQFENVILQITKLGLNFSRERSFVYYAYKLLCFWKIVVVVWMSTDCSVSSSSTHI